MGLDEVSFVADGIEWSWRAGLTNLDSWISGVSA
jgi:hypothetical protein